MADNVAASTYCSGPADSDHMCPACGAQNRQPRTFQFDSGRGVTPWARCFDCHTYFMTSTYDAQVETDHTRHMAWGNEDEGAALNQRRRYGFAAALGRIEELGYSGSRILDVGCSFGGILVEAQKRGFECAGLDIVPEAVAYVRRLGIVAEECSSLNDCTLYSPLNPVDVISVLDAHIYWPDQPAELRAAYRLLRENGLLVIRAITKSALVTAGRFCRLHFARHFAQTDSSRHRRPSFFNAAEEPPENSGRSRV